MKPGPRRLALLMSLAALLSLVPAAAGAQVTTADLVGTIKDSTGGVLPGVTVTLTNQATGVSRTATTGDRRQLHLHVAAARHLHPHRRGHRLPQGRAHGRGTAGQPARPGGPGSGGRRCRRDRGHRRHAPAAREPVVRAGQRHPGEAGAGPAAERPQLRAAGHPQPRRVRRGLRHARHHHERHASRRPAARHRAVRERQPRELEQLPLRRHRQQHPADPGHRHAARTWRRSRSSRSRPTCSPPSRGATPADRSTW